MPIANYSVLAGRPAAGEGVGGGGGPYHVRRRGGGGAVSVLVDNSLGVGASGVAEDEVAECSRWVGARLCAEYGGRGADDYEGADDAAAAVECAGEEWRGGGADDSAGEGQSAGECCGDAAEYDDC